ncbi:MAG: dihydroorotate dehydrogenase electron transfer subunit [Dehalococcoidia bacterium]|jgi:dihydroorotate dehydrogenase electron transfer subunit
MIEETARVTGSTKPMKDAHLLTLKAPGIAAEAKPGQFVMVRCGEKGEYQLRRPLSIHQREGDKIALLFNIVGGGTQWLAQRQPGDMISLLGPLGNGFSINPNSKKLLMIAGGIGIAPLVFLVTEASKRNCETKLLIGGREAALLYPQDLLPEGLDIIYATENATMGLHGMVTTFAPNYFEWADQLFACGPLPMYKAMARMPELKNKPVQISLEVRMGCGVGVCYGCTVKTANGLKQVCKDGPVFELNDIVWDTLPD